LFDNSKKQFYWNKAIYEEDKARQKILFEFYESESKRGELIPFTVVNGEIFADIGGKSFQLNDLEIGEIVQANEDIEAFRIINERKKIDVSAILEKAPSFVEFCGNSLNSKKLKSLVFEFYTGDDDLGYIRAHFKNNCVRFVISGKNSTLYTSGEHGRHEPTSEKELLEQLEIKGGEALREWNEVMTAIR
jgi:hypothetical protein